jgi:hypothetical protein
MHNAARILRKTRKNIRALRDGGPNSFVMWESRDLAGTDEIEAGIFGLLFCIVFSHVSDLDCHSISLAKIQGSKLGPGLIAA